MNRKKIFILKFSGLMGVIFLGAFKASNSPFPKQISNQDLVKCFFPIHYDKKGEKVVSQKICTVNEENYNVVSVKNADNLAHEEGFIGQLEKESGNKATYHLAKDPSQSSQNDKNNVILELERE